MRGSLDKYATKAGPRWRIRWELAADEQGERHRGSRAGFTTEAEAERELALILGDVVRGTHVGRNDATLDAYLRTWLDGIRVKPTTLSNYRVSLEVHLLPRLGFVKLQALTPDHLDKLYRDLERHGARAGDCRTAGVTCGDHGCAPDRHGPLAPKTVRHVHVAVRKALADAQARGYVSRNVADLSNPPRHRDARSRRARDKAWTGEQLRAFMAAREDDRLLPIWRLLASTGLRRAEVLGLRWQHADLDTGLLRVGVETVTTAGNQRVEQDSGKSDAAERTIHLDAGTVAALRSWRQRQLEERLAAGPAWVDGGGRIVTEVDGRPMEPKRLSQVFTAAVDAAGLPRVGVHGLRHTYATAALRAGVSPEIVSKRLGHASVTITLGIYAHVFEHDDQAAADTVADALFGA